MAKTDFDNNGDLTNIEATEDVKAGRFEPINPLLEMIEEDKNWLDENKTAIVD